MCLSPEYSPISFPRRILYFQSVMPLYPSFCTSGIVLGGEFSESLLLLPVYSIETFSSAYLIVISFDGMGSTPFSV